MRRSCEPGSLTFIPPPPAKDAMNMVNREHHKPYRVSESVTRVYPKARYNEVLIVKGCECASIAVRPITRVLVQQVTSLLYQIRGCALSKLGAGIWYLCQVQIQRKYSNIAVGTMRAFHGDNCKGVPASPQESYQVGRKLVWFGAAPSYIIHGVDWVIAHWLYPN